jgi:hypothetical protein
LNPYEWTARCNPRDASKKSTNKHRRIGRIPANRGPFFSVITVITVFSGFLRAEKAEQPTTRTAASGRPEIPIPCAWPSPVSPSYQPISQLQRPAMTRPPRLRHMLKPQIHHPVVCHIVRLASLAKKQESLRRYSEDERKTRR